MLRRVISASRPMCAAASALVTPRNSFFFSHPASQLMDALASPILRSPFPRLSTMPSLFESSSFPSWFDNDAPYVQARESEKAVMLEMEVPRFRQEDIKVTTDKDKGTVSVVGKRTKPHHGEDFDTVLFGSSQLGDFQRTFVFSPEHYDVAKLTSSLESGVFTLIVPKIEPKPEQLEEEAKGTQLLDGSSKDGEVVSKTTPEELNAIRNSRWPPVVHKEETADALTYKCEMPPAVSKDHIQLELKGRSLNLSIKCEYNLRSKHSEEYQSMSYTSSFGVPQGTTAKDISTTYENGVLTISLAKQQSIPIAEAKTDPKTKPAAEEKKPSEAATEERKAEEKKKE